MSENGGAQGSESGGQNGGEHGTENSQQQRPEQTFTQADVDRIVKERAERLYKQRVGDVDIKALKAQAEGAKTAEERIAELEQKYQAAEVARLRSDIAAAHGISAEDRDLFLTGTDEETLTAQAKRLAERVTDRKKQGNYVPREGNNPRPKEDEERAFVRGLFGSNG